jgi:hypothetical protein
VLYAELNGKLDDTASGLERREDILTSTVFGTLLVAGATKVLVDWLKSACCLAGTPERLDRHKRKLRLPYEEPEYWFWPSLSFAQPDIMLRIGSHLLIVEAKYGAPKGILAADSESAEPDAYAGESDPDQLVREWPFAFCVPVACRSPKRFPSVKNALQLSDPACCMPGRR